MKNRLIGLSAGMLLLVFSLPFSAAADMYSDMLAASDAAAAMVQLNFDVPVRVSNVSSDVGAVAASCNVKFSSGSDAMGMPARVYLGSDGSLNQVFRVTVRVSPDRVDDANGYQCSLVLYNSSNNSLLAGGTMIETQSGIPLDPSASQVFVVSGTL